MMDFVSWDDEIPNMESHKIPWFQTTHQFWDVAIQSCAKTDRLMQDVAWIAWYVAQASLESGHPLMGQPQSL